MHKITASLLVFVIALCSSVPSAKGYTLNYTDASANVQIRWPTTTISIALSNSLDSPPSNIKAGSDVVGAAERAFARWGEATGIQFNITRGNGGQSVGQDGVSLVTVSTANAGMFGGSSQPQGRAQVFFNPANGLITEADIAINSGAQFSTDGTNGTFDLESTFMHEIGHLLGLEHSGIVGATMMPRQATNGAYSLPAFTMRTLSDDDRAGVRSIYQRPAGGTVSGMATLRGTVTYAGSAAAAFGAHVWLEDATTGRAVAGNVAISNGAYRIDGIAPGRYRVIVEQLDEPVAASNIAPQGGAYTGLSAAQIPFRTTEAGEVTLSANEDRAGFNISVGNQPFINPTQLGTNNFISSVPVPLAPGTYTLFVAGDNLTAAQIPATGVQINSPFFSVNQSSVFYQTVAFNGTQLPLIGFEATVNANAPSGEYSIRLLANSGEVAYITGGLVVENTSAANPTDDINFFVRQHYLDFLDREPDAGGFEYWTNLLRGCNSDATCLNGVRVEISSRFFAELEFQRTGYYVMRLWRAAYGEFPNYQQFIADRRLVQNNEASQRAFAAQFVTRAEFLARYPANLTAEQFVTQLYNTTGANSFTAERQAHIQALAAGQKTRADILHEVVNLPLFAERTVLYNAAWVRMQYFGYLRRDVEPQGEAYWTNVINVALPNNYQAMICAFLNSSEYHQRFGTQRGQFTETSCSRFY